MYDVKIPLQLVTTLLEGDFKDCRGHHTLTISKSSWSIGLDFTSRERKNVLLSNLLTQSQQSQRSRLIQKYAACH
jgi:hypothetical protein